MKIGAKFDLLIVNGRVVTPNGVTGDDLAIFNGKIVALGPNLSRTARTVVDAAGALVVPGFIDAHVHFNEPGREHWEGLATGSAALIAGGGTGFFDMPLNSSPPLLDEAGFRAKEKAMAKHSLLDAALWGGLVPNNLPCLPALARLGVIGFKAFMCHSGLDEFPAVDKASLREGMARARDLNLPVAVHAESDSLTAQLTQSLRAKGAASIKDYLKSRPIEAETEAIGVALDLAQQTGCALHIVHVSCTDGLRLITQARARGVDVTAETCPHYLLMDQTDLLRLGAVAKCSPPLRPPEERENMWAALNRDWVHTIGSDHSPAPADLKQGDDFFNIWGGIAGCQHAFPLFWGQALGHHGIDPEKLSRLTSTNVAERFHLRRKGRLEEGFDADITLLQMTNCAPVPQEELLYRHKMSPYVGMRLCSQVTHTIARGEIVYAEKKVRRPTRPARILRPQP